MIMDVLRSSNEHFQQAKRVHLHCLSLVGTCYNFSKKPSDHFYWDRAIYSRLGGWLFFLLHSLSLLQFLALFVVSWWGWVGLRLRLRLMSELQCMMSMNVMVRVGDIIRRELALRGFIIIQNFIMSVIRRRASSFCRL